MGVCAKNVAQVTYIVVAFGDGMRRQYEWGSRRFELDIDALGDDRYRLRQGEETLEFSARRLADGCWLIRRGGKTVRVYAHAEGDERRSGWQVGAIGCVG